MSAAYASVLALQDLGHGDQADERVKRNNAKTKSEKGYTPGKVYLIGEGGLEQEFQDAKIEYVGGSKFTSGMEIDADITAILIGWDQNVNDEKRKYAVDLINGGPQKLKMKQIPEIIITNPELTKADGTLHTGTTLDAILKAVDEAAMQTLRQRKWG